MKTTFKFIIVAMAASAVFASCQKELATGNSTESTDGIRVISASFSAPTKSALDTDGKTPKFVGGETIKVSNATESQDRTISIDASGNPYFSTSLTGTLTAVYPSTAAKMNGNIIDESAVLVSTVQDGTFEGANIAMATGITTSATFTNKTAVIKITPGAGESTRYVEVITAGFEIANTTTTDYTKKNKIHVNTTSADPVYVSILVPSGLKVQNLSFADGSNIKTAKDNTTAIAINTISTVSDANWNTPYVEINGLKWATRNIGATADTGPDSYGTYFAWGDKQGQEATNKTGKGSSGAIAFTSHGFTWSTAPFNGGNSNYNEVYFGSVLGDECPGRLALKNDAANVNWGGSWRMPNEIETLELQSLKRGSFDSGYYFGDSEANKIFLPAAGFGSDVYLYYAGEYGHYWSSDFYINDFSKAYCLRFEGTSHDKSPHVLPDGRDGGHSVRAVSD